MSVSFEDAKKTLHSMFPIMDEETIGDILRQQNGHMESAVEVLLSFCGEATPESQIPERPRAAPERSGDEAFPPPSDDFLTLGRYMGGGGGRSLSQLEQDEALARQLQDTLFLQELQSNPRYNSEFQGIWNQGAQVPAGRAAAGAAGGAPAGQDQGADSIFGLSADDVKRRVSEMSASAKHTMAQLAMRIKSAASGTAPTSAPRSAAQYSALNAVDADDRRRVGGFDDDDDDDAEVVAFSRGDQAVSRRNNAHRAADDEDEDPGLVDKRSTKMKPMRSAVTAHGSADDKDD